MSEQQMPLCAVHESLDKSDELVLHIGNGCVACSLNERNELLEMLTPFADGDSVQSLFRLIEKHTALVAVAEAAEKTLSRTVRLFDTAGNGKCGVCGVGYRLFDTKGKLQTCDWPECLSHKWRELEAKIAAWRKG